jgi:SpoVK/Ycf46/Vps4 family AAA+-type ATPase
MSRWPPLPAVLMPRRPGERCDRREALALLESERTVAAALAVRAIAEGWDNGRLGNGPEQLPREREVLGLLGVAQGLAAQRVSEASESLTDVLNRAREVEAAVTAIRPLDELVEEFALSKLARTLLSLVAAPAMWGEIAQLYAIVADEPRRAVDEHLLRQLLGPRADPHAIAHELDPQRPLRRFGLLQMATAPRPFAGLLPHPLVLARLRAEVLAEDPERELDLVTRAKPVAELRLPPSVVEVLQTELAHPPARPFRIVVRGREGSGRRALLAALARLAARDLAIVHADRLGDQLQPSPHHLRRALERCTIAGWIPCIDGVDAIAQQDGALAVQLRQVLAEFPGPLAVRLDRDARPPLEAGYLQIDLPELTETERFEIWRDELAAHGVADETTGLAPLAARWRIGAGTLHRVTTHLAERGRKATSADVNLAVSQHLEQRLGDVAEKIRVLPRLDDMVLPVDILDSVKEFLARLRFQRQVFEDWGMTRVATTARGITALFQGPPGTGKTMIAGALARELGIDLYRVDLSKVMSKWIGETERNLANVFSAAEQSQAILLFDEADSLFSKRTEVKSSNDRFANLEVNYLLQRLDSFLGIAILTTNLGTAIDNAFKRRLTFRIQFPVPDEEQREQLWRVHLPPSLPRDGELELADLARKYPLTGGSVRNCVLRATFLAAAENVALSHDHLMRAIRLEYRAYGKLSESGTLE